MSGLRRNNEESFLSVDPYKLRYRLYRNNDPKGGVLFLHGLCSNLSEMGIYTLLERRFSADGYTTLRFDFRGHGGSSGGSKSMSISGEMQDLKIAYEFLAKNCYGKPIGIVATSLGASILFLSNPKSLSAKTIALLNPVLSYYDTFIEPTTPWGKEFFGKDKISRGSAILMENCWIGEKMVAELGQFRPELNAKNWRAPIFIIHGDRDDVVPYKTSVDFVRDHENAYLSTIPGTGHGFDTAEKRRIIVELVKHWMQATL